MGLYHHILVAVDLGEGARLLIPRAALLARHIGAKVTLLHVIEHFPEDLPVEDIPREDEDPAAHLEHESRKQVMQLAREAGLENAAVRIEFSTRGAPASIMQTAQTLGADLIVMGAHSHHLAAHFFGQTADDIAGRTATDVLVVAARLS